MLSQCSAETGVALTERGKRCLSVVEGSELEVGEDIGLGWEWDYGNAVHMLPAISKTPHMFP